MGGAIDFIKTLIGGGNAIKDATDGAIGIIDAAKGQLPPEQQVQSEKIKADLQSHAADVTQAIDKQLQDFTTQYEGSAAEVGKIAPWLVILRDVIRPITTIIFILQLTIIVNVDLYRYLFLGSKGWDLLTGLPSGYWVILSIIIGFWFGGKAGERIVTAFGQAKS
jgi:hypothetical protein